MLSRFIPCLATAAALVTAAPAVAAPPWTSPAPVGDGAVVTTPPTVAYGQGGSALVAWTRPCNPCMAGRDQGVRLAAGTPGGAYRVFRDVGGTLADDPVAYGSTRAVILRHKSLDDRGTVRLGVSFGRTDGDIDPQRALDEYEEGDGAAIAANARGDVVVAWIEERAGRDLLWMAERRGGRPFTKRRVIRSGRRMSDVDVAVGSDGDFVVAYRRADTLEARFKRADGGLEGPVALGPTDDITQISTSVARTGRMVVAWGAQDGGIEANQPYVVRVAVRPAGPRAFRQATTVEPGGPNRRPEGGIRAALAPDGTGVVAWTAVQVSSRRHSFPVRVASVTANARVTPGGEQVTDSGRLGDVTVAPDGTTTVVWTDLGGPEGFSPGRTRAAIQLPGVLRFGPPEDVSGDVTAGAARAALDPSTNRPTVVWSQAPVPQGRPLPDARAVVHASTRAAG